jgi:hypothetical protein
VDASVAVAGFGYVVTGLLAATSNDYSVRRLGHPKWKQLHTVGVSILMLYFFVAFSGPSGNELCADLRGLCWPDCYGGRCEISS